MSCTKSGDWTLTGQCGRIPDDRDLGGGQDRRVDRTVAVKVDGVPQKLRLSCKVESS